MSIAEIAENIEQEALNTPIGHLQELRKSIKQLERRPNSRIFSSSTISDEWAFHFGGRTELQFNIGYESDGSELRYGVAFSLEPSQTLPDISILFPKIRRFNHFMDLNPRYFDGFSMWHYANQDDDGILYRPSTIADSLLVQGNFIFIGNKMPIDAINYGSIVQSWNYLLTIYKYVEAENGVEPDEIDDSGAEIAAGINFVAGHRPSQANAMAQLDARSVDINIRHAVLQDALYNELLNTIRPESVGTEISVFRNRIDLVVKREGEEIFYEIKTASTAKSCVREAIGQLLEYCFYKCGNTRGFATKLIVIGEPCCDQSTTEYLGKLSELMQIPIEYKQITA